VLSDHGFEIFHTTVLLNNLLANAGIDPSQARAVTSGPAANIYINLKNREANGTVSAADYIALQQKIVSVLRSFFDTNPLYTNGFAQVPVFDQVFARPIPADINDPTLGRKVSPHVGQDFGDVFALLTAGYNFDGAQAPLVTRSGDMATALPTLTLPNFYGAHGYDPNLVHMSAVFYAAGPDIEHRSEPLEVVHNIDVALTIERILGVTPSSLVQGKALHLGTAPLQLVQAVSRKIHGGAGAFDVPLALEGTPTVECRRQSLFLGHDLVFTFSNTLTAGSASIPPGEGISITQIEGNKLIVHLWGIRDGQTLKVTLNHVSDGRTVLAPVSVNVAFLFGDIVGSGLVDQSDVNEVRSDALDRGELNSETFRADILLDGRVDEGDILLDQLSVGNRLRN